eukprot:NODE_1020_length_2648_cov_5.422451.p1 GENE.NODE_1020_length_2648_cov_5.422451~~NODE_1020_length_2648_cov_5.422451.p1  ORF type:complete len:741 (-),score=238.33 NODE_1020_length_2648_cov_5.422451:322-2544(-)
MGLALTYAEESYTTGSGAAAVGDGAAAAGPPSGMPDKAPPAAAPGKDNYPSTPHLPFSPGVNPDDICLADCQDLLHNEVVVTEKLDGGNCCIKGGQIYARTHGQPATHASFSAVKQLAQSFGGEQELEGVDLFGENMQAVHSIEYGNLQAFFYVFAARRRGVWLAWDDVVALATRLELPVVPLLFRGSFESPQQLQHCLEQWAQECSAVGAAVTPEGFVVRRAESFGAAAFAGCIAKFVRASHIQTGDAWRRNWKKTRLGAALPAAVLRTVGYPLRTKLTDPRERHKVTVAGLGEVELQQNFSFLLDDVAVSSMPKTAQQVIAMADMGITLIVTLTKETRLPPAWFAGTKVRNLYVPVPNFHAPTTPQADEVLAAIASVAARGEKAMVHCRGGKGRAGCVAAAVLLRYGIESVGERATIMQSSEALAYLRDVRPGSIENERQEAFIHGYASTLWQRAASGLDKPEPGEDAAAAPAAAAAAQTVAGRARPKKKKVEAETRLREQLRPVPKYIVMCGLAGSGKSTFTHSLVESGAGWVRASHDDLGRTACDELVRRMAPQVKNDEARIVVDRCNLTRNERATWLDKFLSPPAHDVACVFFDFTAEACKRRAAARLNHPKIRSGGRGDRIIEDQAKQLERPVAAEGFGAVEVVASFEDAAALLRHYAARAAIRMPAEETAASPAPTAHRANPAATAAAAAVEPAGVGDGADQAGADAAGDGPSLGPARPPAATPTRWHRRHKS